MIVDTRGLAAARVLAAANLGHDHFTRGVALAGDDERLAQRPGLAADDQSGLHDGAYIYMYVGSGGRQSSAPAAAAKTTMINP